MAGSAPLRIALLVYRGNPHSGGQGVYTRYLSRELVDLGHQVTVFAGQPWPVLDDGVGYVAGARASTCTASPTRSGFRCPWEFRSRIDVAEFALMCTAGFPEPLHLQLAGPAGPGRPARPVRRGPRQPDASAAACSA